MAKLVIISEEMKDRVFELTDDKVTVGRLPDNHILLDENAISSHHAELTRKGDDYVLRDLNSTNGTRVNGQRIVETRLYHGDTVNFGQLHLQYFSTAKGAPQPLPALSKKPVDLSNSSSDIVRRPTSFKSSSPFSKQRQQKAKRIFSFFFLLLGFVGIVCLAIAIIRMFPK